MPEYIERSALRAEALRLTGASEFAFDYCFPYWQFSKCIKEAPAADVETVRHGKWIYKGKSVDGKKVYECSACHANIYATGPYCKECGAKMMGKEDEI